MAVISGIRMSTAGEIADSTLLIAAVASVPNRFIIYSTKSDNQPMAFKCDTGAVFPSVYYLWQQDCGLPFLFVNSFTSSFILGGAHLMNPGILRHPRLPPYQPFRRGDSVIIIVVGNPLPIAVGVAEMSSDEILAAGDGVKGKAVSIVHYFGDGLWQIGTKTIPPGFGFERVEPCSPDIVESVPAPEVIIPSPESTTASTLDQAETDSLVMCGFYDAAKSISDSDLPMNASSLFSRIQISAKSVIQSDSCLKRIGEPLVRLVSVPLSERSSFKLDLKRSSHKQAKTLVSHLSDLNLASFKVIRGDIIITNVASQHPTVKAFVSPPPVVSMEAIGDSKMVDVTVQFGISSGWKTVLATTISEGSRKELVDIANAFLRDQKGAEIAVTPSIRALLKRDHKLLDSIEKREFMETFNDALISIYSLSTELPPRIHKGSPPPVHITVKRIQGKKFCTYLKGLGKYHLKESDIAQCVSKQFSVSASVSADGVYCQGNLGDKLSAWLVGSVGVPKESIVVIGKS